MVDEVKATAFTHIFSVYVDIDIKAEMLYNANERRLKIMKKFLTIISSVIGLFTLAAGILLVVDRFVYHNGPKCGYISCDCETDAE